jgi:hypothetical protein
MAWVLRWKLSAVMAAAYAVAAGAVILFVRDQATAVAALVMLFALVLIAGNVYAKHQGAGSRVRGAGTNPGAGCGVRGAGYDETGTRFPAPRVHPAPGTLHPAPSTPHPDPELGRR